MVDFPASYVRLPECKSNTCGISQTWNQPISVQNLKMETSCDRFYRKLTHNSNKERRNVDKKHPGYCAMFQKQFLSSGIVMKVL